MQVKEVSRWYRPEDVRIGDIIPFYWEGTYHLFYLKYFKEFWRHTPPGARHTPWGHLASADLVHWEERPTAISPGQAPDLDAGSCATGGVFAHDGLFHIYYTGRYFTTEGKKREVICHATSDDLDHWEKDVSNPIAGPDDSRFSLENWRDPHVLWNPQAKEFWMIITAELKDGPDGHRGCLALLKSKDLKEWKHSEPFWAPYTSFHHECPDVFQWGDWWYLIYSAEGRTQYRMSSSITAPWRSAYLDDFDDRFFYAAKSAGDENRRILFGWLADKNEDKDAGAWEWGGSWACRELIQNPDGTLRVKCPVEYIANTTHSELPQVQPQLGKWHVSSERATNDTTDGLAYAIIDNVPHDCKIQLSFKAEGPTKAHGLILRTNPNLSSGYMLRFEPTQNRVVLGSISSRGRITNDIERRLPPIDGELTCLVIMKESVIDVYVADQVALIGRFHDHHGSSLALFVEEGSMSFQEVIIGAVD